MAHADYPLIDDTYRQNHLDGTRGYMPRDWKSIPLGSLKCAPRLSLPLIDMAEVPQRIADKTAAKTWISDICDLAGLPVKNQQQTNFCWANAPTHCVEIDRVMQGQPVLVLSAASVACQINGFRNEGGSGTDAVQWISKSGVCTDALWPNAAISRQYQTPTATADATNHIITQFFDLDSSNDQEIITCLLNDIPVSVGIPAWGHEVTLTFLTWDSTFHYGFDNSWGTSYGNNGRGVLSRSYSRFDEAIAPGVVTPSSK